MQVAHTLSCLRSRLSPGQCGQQEGRENGDDRDDDQEFNQSESAAQGEVLFVAVQAGTVCRAVSAVQRSFLRVTGCLGKAPPSLLAKGWLLIRKHGY